MASFDRHRAHPLPRPRDISPGAAVFGASVIAPDRIPPHFDKVVAWILSKDWQRNWRH